MVVSAALGGGKRTPGKPVSVRDPGVKDVTAGAQTVEQAVFAMNRMLSLG